MNSRFGVIIGVQMSMIRHSSGFKKPISSSFLTPFQTQAMRMMGVEVTRKSNRKFKKYQKESEMTDEEYVAKVGNLREFVKNYDSTLTEGKFDGKITLQRILSS
jgi:hypothetical protein